MQITLFGWVFMPLALAVLLRARPWLPGLLLGSAVFQAAAVVNIPVGAGHFGISPYVATASMAGLLMLWRLLGPEKSPITPPAHVRAPAIWLLLYATVAIIGSFVLPRVFAGYPVQAPLEPNGYILEKLPPLAWGISNLAQAANLTIHLASAFFMWQSMRRSDWSARKTVASFGLAAAAALLASMHERLALVMDWPRMTAFWMSNSGYALVESLDLAFPIPYSAPAPDGSTYTFFHRIASPFSEPSYGSAFFATVYAGLLAVFLFAPGTRKYSLVGMLLCGIGLLNTTGATGWVAGLGATLLLVAGFLWKRLPKLQKSPTPPRKSWGLLVTAFLVLSTSITLLWQSPMIRTVPAIADIFLFNKVRNLQNDVRILSDTRALALTQQTIGLGLGMGSNRTSSFLTSLLSNTGIAGTVTFLGMVITLIARFLRADQLTDRQYFALAALSTCLVAVLLAIPDLNLPFFWAFIFLAFVLNPEDRATGTFSTSKT